MIHRFQAMPLLATVALAAVPLAGCNDEPAANVAAVPAAFTQQAGNEDAGSPLPPPVDETTARRILADNADQSLIERIEALRDGDALAGVAVPDNVSGPVVTDTGLFYYVIEPGEGEPLGTSSAKATADYAGYLLDGSKFDASADRGEAAEFQLWAVIQGWQQGVPLMSRGATWKFVIPAELAYGRRGSPPVIGPDEPLIFDVTLRDWVDYTAMPEELPGEPLEGELKTTRSGLRTATLTPGTGESPESRFQVVNYTFNAYMSDGSSAGRMRARGSDVTAPIAQNMPGLTEALLDMNVGELRKLVLPGELAFADRGFRQPGTGRLLIPPHAVLIIDLELLDLPPIVEPDIPEELPGEAVDGQPTRSPSGLVYYDLHVGDGPEPERTDVVRAHYTGWLTDGTPFDSSRDEGREPIEVSLEGGVIAGWLEGLASMKVGSRRKLIIPYTLAYGEQGRGNRIPPKATLIFDVELLAIVDPDAEAAADDEADQ